ncbi:GntR family transcriptional regulator [Novosphingobium sp. PS1R-30]|uniref:GntR family transcriptional regulator n=2 Tax=Novosphingobium anseongense TaxID=3133436 RepID=A0ABU8S1I8_9SPHN
MLKTFGRLDDTDATPKYMQIERMLRAALASDSLRPEDALPTERDLAEELGVSRITIRKAIGALVDEGLLHRRHGAGTFVAGNVDRIEKSSSKISSFSEDMIARGLKPRSEWVSKSNGSVTPEEAINMGLSPGTPVYRFNRIRFADDLPMALEYSTIDATCLASIDTVDASLYEALAQAGHRPTRALQRLRAIGFDDDRAALLGMPSGSPGLLIERRGFTKAGRLIELTTSYYRGDAYDFVAELSD